MKRIMTGVILVLAVLVFSCNGTFAQPEGKIAKNQTIHIKIKKDKNDPSSQSFNLKIQIKDQDGEPEVVGEEWEDEGVLTDLPSNMMMSVHFENPCRVCFGSPPRCYIKRNC